MSNFNDYLSQKMKDPAFKAEYDALEPEFSIIQAMIDAAVTAARPPVYTSVENCPAWARETVQKAVDEGVLRGDQGGGLRLTDDNLVNLQMLRNLGLLDGGGA